ncbi:penicillin-binding protein 1A [Arhodomonas sp. AD133]|uniref:penicillin-binding protein 1A n=1 Tax=Arhodomonas sp. AD133 TaxID=3415009 RepID=UPI003EBCE458
MKRLLRALVYGLASLAALGFVAVLALALGYYLLAPGLPPVERLREVDFQEPLRVYTRDRRLIAEFGSQRRIPLHYEQFPSRVVDAFMAAEDQRFFEHPGVDYQGLMRAVWYLVRTGEKGPGGSTITMQVARNFFLSPEQTYIRKAREILLALEIERLLSKEEIMELYLNKIYLGEGAYGVAAAARIYYGRSLDELDLAQTAMIAGLPKAPSAWNPVANPGRAVERRNYVLRRMFEMEMIDSDTYAQARQAPITAEVHRVRPEVDAPYVAETVRQRLVARFGKEVVYTEGYRVYTTIDGARQKAARAALQQGLHAYDERHGWRGPVDHLDVGDEPDASAMLARLGDYEQVSGLINAAVVKVDDEGATLLSVARGEPWRLPFSAMQWAKPFRTRDVVGPAPDSPSDVLSVGDIVRVRETPDGPRLAQIPEPQGALVSLSPHDGAVEALVGGYDFGLSNFNRVLQAERQPGSAFKPFVYSAALENGFTPATIVNDAPVVFHDPSLEATWRPQNYSQRFFGPTRLRKALIHSRNLVSIRVLRRVGVQPTIDHIAGFGFQRDSLPRNLSLSLGTASVTPMQLARGYSVFANGGHLVAPYLIERVENDLGEVIYEPVHYRVCEPTCDANDDDVAAGAAGLDSGGLDLLPGAVSPALAETASVLPAPRVLPADNAWLMGSMLRDVVRHGTGRKAMQLGRNDLAGKTGTTNDQVDAWFSGFNGELVTTAWVGFDRLQPLGRAETGGRAALPIWVDYMDDALDGVPESVPDRPAGLVSVRIDRETGLRSDGDGNSMVETFRAGHVPERGAAGANGTYGSGGAGAEDGGTLF